MAVEYRKWLLRELFDLVFSLEINAFNPDVNMVLNLIDGLMLQVLSSNSLDERNVVLERFWGRETEAKSLKLNFYDGVPD